LWAFFAGIHLNICANCGPKDAHKGLCYSSPTSNAGEANRSFTGIGPKT